MDNPANVAEVIGKLASLTKEMHDVLQFPIFDSIALSKRAQLEGKLARGDFARVGTVFLGHHLKHARPVNSEREFVVLEPEFLSAPPRTVPPGSVFLLLNNDIGPRLPQYLEFYARHPESLFVIWDWDSQHWVQMSCSLALNSDFYLPATSENAFLLSHFNPHVLGPFFVATHQWSRRFLIDNFARLLEERSSEPLGAHVFYPNHPRRNRAVATVLKSFPTVCFGNNDYKKKTDLDNLVEWGHHKTHWIMPVLGGVPIRVFNALITGGIPILPAFYKNLPEIALLGETPVYYEVADLIEPSMINEAALAKFDSGGESGLIERISNAIEHHHVDARCERIFCALEQAIGHILEKDRSYDQGYAGARLAASA